MTSERTQVRLVGIGGCGATVIEDLLLEEEWASSCVVLTSDHQTAKTSSAEHVIKIDDRVFELDADDGESQYNHSEMDELKIKVRQVLRGADVVVLTAGMGTGTGTELGLLVAHIARDIGSLVLAFVTTPFAFEGERRARLAQHAITRLENVSHATIVLSNRRLVHALGHRARMADAFNASITVLKDALRGIWAIVDQNGLINLDLSDLHAALDKPGLSMIGRGEARGENMAETAVLRAISNQLVETGGLKHAQSLIVTLHASIDFSLGNLDETGELLRNLFGNETDILIGVTLDVQLYNSVIATVLATGIPAHNHDVEPSPEPPKVAWHVRA